jgi:hypothetical protein
LFVLLLLLGISLFVALLIFLEKRKQKKEAHSGLLKGDYMLSSPSAENYAVNPLPVMPYSKNPVSEIYSRAPMSSRNNYGYGLGPQIMPRLERTNEF